MIAKLYGSATGKTGLLVIVGDTTSPRETAAERLLKVVAAMDRHEGLITAVPEHRSVDYVRVAALVYRLEAARPAVKLRAIVEDWNLDRIVRELNV